MTDQFIQKSAVSNEALTKGISSPLIYLDGYLNRYCRFFETIRVQVEAGWCQWTFMQQSSYSTY